MLCRTEDRILVLTLNRPDKRNALTLALIAELHQRIQAALSDTNVGGIVITGAPPAFSAGLDLNEVAASRSDPAKARATADALYDLLNGIYSSSKPIVAAVNGFAVAGGAGLMSACDLVVAAKSAQIGYPEIKRGLVAAIVMSFLARQVGERRAKYLLLTGDLLDGAAAREAGLVNEVVEPDRVVPRAIELAVRVAAYAPQAYSDTKHMLRQIQGLDPAEAMDRARAIHTQMRTSSQADAGISSFLGKQRPPGD
ncbi:MAG TPA: enoyl-CoA hydratase/isomerase family protein [Phycisphaerae bacterium]